MLIFLFLIVIVILITYIYNLKKEIINISKQMQESKEDYFNVKTNSVGSAIEELVKNINYVYEQLNREKVEKEKNEEELKKSIANMSHDLRTPLTSILGYIQILKCKNVSEKESEEYMEIIEKRTTFLKELISSFYDMSRLDNNEYKFNLKKVNLGKILCNNIALYYNDFEEKNIEPIIEIEKNTEQLILDEDIINRVFNNLINNMIKHGTGAFKIKLKNNKEYIITEFSNNVEYLEKEDIKYLFDRFYTCDKSRNKQNTGLGLYISKVFIEKLGHKIDIELKNNNFKIIIIWNLNKDFS